MKEFSPRGHVLQDTKNTSTVVKQEKKNYTHNITVQRTLSLRPNSTKKISKKNDSLPKTQL